MASILKVLEFLRKLCTATDYITRFPGRGVSLLAFLGRKLIIWWRSWFGKPGRPKPAERPSLGAKASSYSVSGGSAIVREYAIAASSVPPSGSHPSLHERTESQPPAPVVTQTASVHHPPAPAGPSVDRPHAHSPLPHPRGGSSLVVNRSYATLSAVSTQSRASDRFSIITTSRDALRSTHGRPSRGAFTPFGPGPDPSRFRERLTQPTPTTHPHRPTHASLLEVISTTLPSADEDGKVGPVVQPLASSSHTHEPLPVNETRRRQPPTSPMSVVVNVQSPSTKLPMSSLTDQRQITDTVVNLHDKPGSSMSTNPPTVDYFIPDGRFVQLFNSEQIPRYDKGATM